MNDVFTIVNGSGSREVIETIARRTAAYRKRQGLSLDQLAVRAGVSKASLSGLERGTGNPGIALLCQTAAALGVSVADLLAASASRKAETFRFREGKILWKGKHGGTARLLFGTPGPAMFEMWDWEMFPGERYEAKAHSPGTKEMLYAVKGRLGAVVDGETFETGPGQGIFIESDVPHDYYCAGKQPVRFRMMVAEMPAGKPVRKRNS